ncbi:MAG TPA: hypothetical protein VNO84_07660 [Burkholderiaceae bacterium]|nr:hypothetical protein [Burkholderiaceae bacterium]
MDANHRLHLATKIHFGLLRHLGEGIDVGAMLKREDYALDVVNVCLACTDPELRQLAAQFVEASAPPGHAVQDGPWARNTSGFGALHEPPPRARQEPAAAPAPHWWERWGLRRKAER